MAVRNIIHIDESKCNGCGACVVDCAEGALAIIDGKARLVRESYCDGLGACLGACPTGALRIERREADEFDEAAVAEHVTRAASPPGDPAPCETVGEPARSGCPGTPLLQLFGSPPGPAAEGSLSGTAGASELRQWPVQLALVPPGAPFLPGADVLLAADCAPFALADFHGRLLRGRALLVACPKLDDRAAHAARLRAILEQARPKSITLARMEVPCCGGLGRLLREAVAASGSGVPVSEIVVGLDGKIVAENPWEA